MLRRSCRSALSTRTRPVGTHTGGGVGDAPPAQARRDGCRSALRCRHRRRAAASAVLTLCTDAGASSQQNFARPSAGLFHFPAVRVAPAAPMLKTTHHASLPRREEEEEKKRVLPMSMIRGDFPSPGYAEAQGPEILLLGCAGRAALTQVPLIWSRCSRTRVRSSMQAGVPWVSKRSCARSSARRGALAMHALSSATPAAAVRARRRAVRAPATAARGHREPRISEVPECPAPPAASARAAPGRFPLGLREASTVEW